MGSGFYRLDAERNGVNQHIRNPGLVKRKPMPMPCVSPGTLSVGLFRETAGSRFSPVEISNSQMAGYLEVIVN
jgi:hypothetical protein